MTSVALSAVLVLLLEELVELSVLPWLLVVALVLSLLVTLLMIARHPQNTSETLKSYI